MNVELLMKKRPAEASARLGDDDVDDHEVEQFFALIRNNREARDRFSRSSKLRRSQKPSNNNSKGVVDEAHHRQPEQGEIIIKAERTDDEEKLIWIPSFKWEDFVDIPRLGRSESSAADATELTFYNGPHLVNNDQEEEEEEDHSGMKGEGLDLNLSL